MVDQTIEGDGGSAEVMRGQGEETEVDCVFEDPIDPPELPDSENLCQLWETWRNMQFFFDCEPGVYVPGDQTREEQDPVVVRTLVSECRTSFVACDEVLVAARSAVATRVYLDPPPEVGLVRWVSTDEGANRIRRLAAPHVERVLLCRAEGDRKGIFKELLALDKGSVPDLDVLGRWLAVIDSGKPDDVLRPQLREIFGSRMAEWYGT